MKKLTTKEACSHWPKPESIFTLIFSRNVHFISFFSLFCFKLLGDLFRPPMTSQAKKVDIFKNLFISRIRLFLSEETLEVKFFINLKNCKTKAANGTKIFCVYSHSSENT